MSNGQIRITTKAGQTIFELCRQEDIQSVVEIGTWKGGGSTNCVLQAIKNTNKTFITIECHEEMYKIAQDFNPNTKNVKFLLGHIVEIEELDSENLSDKHKEFIKYDIENISKTKNVFKELPNQIDLLILDGGEFSSRSEFLKLKNRCNYIFLDDTTKRKNKQNREDMINCKHYKVIVDDQHDRNGYSVFKRVV